MYSEYFLRIIKSSEKLRTLLSIFLICYSTFGSTCHLFWTVQCAILQYQSRVGEDVLRSISNNQKIILHIDHHPDQWSNRHFHSVNILWHTEVINCMSTIKMILITFEVYYFEWKDVKRHLWFFSDTAATFKKTRFASQTPFPCLRPLLSLFSDIAAIQ